MAGLFDLQTLQPLPPTTTTTTTTTLTSLFTTTTMESVSGSGLPPMDDSKSALNAGESEEIPNTFQDYDQYLSLKENVDHFFLIVCGSIIIFMQAGFGFLEAGSVRSKNVTNILIKNFADLCFGVLSYILFGYGLAFGEGSPAVGLSGFALVGVNSGQYSYVFFQATFAATCATIVSGSIAERCNFNGYIFFAIMMTGVVYPIQSHWAWSSSGWLTNTEFHDFAGSGVVHLSGGVVAFVGAFMLGPRIGRFKKDSMVTVQYANKGGQSFSGHSIPLISLGGFILVFGFMAFNGGSQGAIGNPGDGAVVSRAVINTLASCCIGGNTVLFIFKFLPGGSWSLTKFINGCLVGMVSICAGADIYSLWASIVVSAISGILYAITSKLMVAIEIDDPLDAVAVHGAGGLIGIIASPILSNSGILFTGSEEAFLMLMWNSIGAGVFIVYNALAGIVIFGILKMLKLFRVDAKHEIEGLDWIKHKEPAYPIDAYIEDKKERPFTVHNSQFQANGAVMENGSLQAGGPTAPQGPGMWARRMSLTSDNTNMGWNPNKVTPTFTNIQSLPAGVENGVAYPSNRYASQPIPPPPPGSAPLPPVSIHPGIVPPPAVPPTIAYP